MTEYAKSQGCCIEYVTRDARNGNAGWMLRSPCHTHKNIIGCVGGGGEIGSGGFACSSAMYYALEAIAPALYIKIR